MNNIMNDLTNTLYQKLKNIMDDKPIEDQKEALRIMISTFVSTGRNKNLPIMSNIIIDFISKEYPHLKPDLDKLIILL